MALLPSQNVLTNLIILLVCVVIPNVDCRSGHGRGRFGRIRLSHVAKNKFHSKSIHGPSSILRQSNHHILVHGAAGGSAALIVGGLALRSYVSNNNKASIQSHLMLNNGTGSLCVNKENISNFVFNEFHCPLSPIFTTNDRYCCGAFQQQYCCSFWESGDRAIGATVGIISTCSVFLLFIFCFIIYYRRHLKRKESPRVKSYLRYKQPTTNRQTIG